MHRTIGGAESVVVALKELFEVILEDGLERVGGAAGPVGRSSQSRLDMRRAAGTIGGQAR